MAAKKSLRKKSTEPIPVVSQPELEKVLYTWEAPSRLFKKRNREFYSTVLALVVLVSVILLFAKEFLLIGVVLSLGFVAYVLATIEPGDAEHKLTNRGIRTSAILPNGQKPTEKLYPWQELSRYWWEEKWKQKVLHVETPFAFPGKLILLLGKGEKADIEEVINKYVLREKPEPTLADKASKWIQEKVPLETN